MTRDLDGLVALVTGGSRRIGLAIARDLAEAGAHVVISYVADREAAASAVETIRARGRQAIAVRADVRIPEQVQAMIQTIAGHFGRLDILVNSAALRSSLPLPDMTLAQWHDATDVVLDGAFLCAQAAEALLTASGHGTIVNIGGLTANVGAARSPHVSTAKMGLVGLTRSLALHFGPSGVTVNCVVPGSIAAIEDLPDRTTRYAPLETIPMRRYGTPEDLAGVVRAVVGPAFRWVTGQAIQVNGGAFFG